MVLDPPAPHYHSIDPNLKCIQPFEIALIRKIESKTKTVRDAFLLLDTDGDGNITPTDVCTVLHNEFGMDVTNDQEIFIRSRFSGNFNGDDCRHDTVKGMGYAEFAKYFNDVSSKTFPTSQSGLAAAVGFHSDSENEMIPHELPINLTLNTTRLKLRYQLRQTLTVHSSRTHGGSGMKETSLFLAIDVHRSGKITMQDFLDWLNSVGMEWDMEKLKLAVLGCDTDEHESEKWFVKNDTMEGKEIVNGMTEHEFAELVESLDKNYDGGCDESDL